MGRRKADQVLPRLVLLLLALNIALCVVVAVIGYKASRLSTLAIDTLETYNTVMKEIIERRHRPEPFPGF